jgi:AcrR family transcriptional regulator
MVSMPATKVTEEFLLDRIAHVFREHGYDGASIRLLSEATGLERASLYHRFPGGKEEIAGAVVARTCEWFAENVFAVLQGEGSPKSKVRRVAANLREFYAGGTLWCVLDSMTLGSGAPSIRAKIEAAYRAWVEAFAAIARESGATAAQARSRAERALIDIEGSLVISRVLNDRAPFSHVLDGLPEFLTGG